MWLLRTLVLLGSATDITNLVASEQMVRCLSRVESLHAPPFAGFRAPEVVDCIASTVACDVFSAGVFVAMLLRELVPSAFGAVDDVLGEEDLSADDIGRLQHSLERDKALPAPAKELLIAVLDPSPAHRPSARRVLSYAFLTTESLPATPISSRKRAHPPSPPSSSSSSPEQIGE